MDCLPKLTLNFTLYEEEANMRKFISSYGRNLPALKAEEIQGHKLPVTNQPPNRKWNGPTGYILTATCSAELFFTTPLEHN